MRGLGGVFVLPVLLLLLGLPLSPPLLLPDLVSAVLLVRRSALLLWLGRCQQRRVLGRFRPRGLPCRLLLLLALGRGGAAVVFGVAAGELLVLGRREDSAQYVRILLVTFGAVVVVVMVSRLLLAVAIALLLLLLLLIGRSPSHFLIGAVRIPHGGTLTLPPQEGLVGVDGLPEVRLVGGRVAESGPQVGKVLAPSGFLAVTDLPFLLPCGRIQQAAVKPSTHYHNKIES